MPFHKKWKLGQTFITLVFSINFDLFIYVTLILNNVPIPIWFFLKWSTRPSWHHCQHQFNGITARITMSVPLVSLLVSVSQNHFLYRCHCQHHCHGIICHFWHHTVLATFSITVSFPASTAWHCYICQHWLKEKRLSTGICLFNFDVWPTWTIIITSVIPSTMALVSLCTSCISTPYLK